MSFCHYCEKKNLFDVFKIHVQFLNNNVCLFTMLIYYIYKCITCEHINQLTSYTLQFYLYSSFIIIALMYNNYLVMF